MLKKFLITFLFALNFSNGAIANDCFELDVYRGLVPPPKNADQIRLAVFDAYVKANVNVPQIRKGLHIKMAAEWIRQGGEGQMPYAFLLTLGDSELNALADKLTKVHRAFGIPIVAKGFERPGEKAFPLRVLKNMWESFVHTFKGDYSGKKHNITQKLKGHYPVKKIEAAVDRMYLSLDAAFNSPEVRTATKEYRDSLRGGSGGMSSAEQNNFVQEAYDENIEPKLLKFVKNQIGDSPAKELDRRVLALYEETLEYNKRNRRLEWENSN